MRQLRVRSESCHVGKSLQTIFVQCEDEYSIFNEEKRSFERGWGNVTEQASNASSVDRAFGYQSSEQLDTNQWVAGNHHTYGSGGYVYDFRGRLQDLKSNLSQLHRANWIDGQTRAVIVQFTLYSPNVQLFTSVILLAEFLATGGIETQSSFQPISFQSNHLCPHLTNSLSLHDAVFTSLTHLIASILYLVLIVHMMMVEVQSLIKLKRAYFRQFWSYIDAGIIACSWTSVGIYVWRYRELNRIGDLFSQTHGYAYVNLQQAVYINEVFSLSDCLGVFLRHDQVHPSRSFHSPSDVLRADPLACRQRSAVVRLDVLGGVLGVHHSLLPAVRGQAAHVLDAVAHGSDAVRDDADEVRCSPAE